MTIGFTDVPADVRKMAVWRLLGKRRVDNDGCWIYTGGLDLDGYGRECRKCRTNRMQRARAKKRAVRKEQHK